MNICIVGQGYVGLPIAIESAKSGNTVFGYDIDLKKIESLKNGSSLLPESTKLEIESLQDQGKLIFISDLLQAININIYIISGFILFYFCIHLAKKSIYLLNLFAKIDEELSS
jgi:UDP-N-acetyl-D-glucosamine dehydrogenase